MSTDSSSGVPFSEHRQSIFGGAYRLLSKIDRTRLTAAYWVADEVDDQYLLIEFLNRNSAQAGSATPQSWHSSDGPELADFMQLVEKLSRLRHPNIEPILQFFEDNGTGYAVVQSRIARSLSDEIDRNAFFHQPPEVLKASHDLVEAVAYCTAMHIRDAEISLDAVSIDDDGNPMISIRHFLEDMLDAKGEGHAPDLAYGVSQCIYAMMTGVIPDARHVRKQMIAAGQTDPVVRTSELDLPYPVGVRNSVDKALSPDPMDPTAVLVWARKFGSDEPVEDVTPAPQKPKKKGGSALVIAGAVAAALFALFYFGGDFVKLRGEGESSQSTTSSDGEAPQGVETALATPQATEPASTTPAATPSVTEPEAPSVPTSETTPEAPKQAVTPEVEPSDVGSTAGQDESEARRQVSAADLEAVLRDLAGNSTPAASDGSDNNQQPASPAEVQEPSAPTVAEPAVPDAQEQPADQTIALSDPAQSSDDPAASTAPQGQQVLEDAFSTDAITGITWQVTDRIGYEVVAQDGAEAFMRLRSMDNHFSFVTKNPWYARNSEIRSVGAQDVDGGFSLQQALSAYFAGSDQSSPLIDVTVTYDGSSVEQAKIDIPVEATRSFGSIQLAQRNVGGTWKLVVDGVQNSASDLRAGDQILSVPGVEGSLETISQFIAMVETEKAKGRGGVDVSVRRGAESVIVVSVDFGDL